MNRRLFFKTLAAAGVIATVPALSAVPAWEPEKALPSVVTGIKRIYETFDYGAYVGLGVACHINGVRYRHAVKMSAETWESMTHAQREETWRWVQALVISNATGRSISVPRRK